MRHQLDGLLDDMIKRAEAFERAAKILRTQASHRNASRIWQKSVSDRGVGNDVINLVSDVRWFEETGVKRGTTWGEGKDKGTEATRSKHNGLHSN